jgi:hypothetical protein
MSLYGQFTPSLIASANADLSDNDLRNIASAAEGFTVTGVLTRRGIEVPRYDSTDPAYASQTANSKTALIAAPDNLGSAVVTDIYGSAFRKTRSYALVWVKNTGSRYLYLYYVSPDNIQDTPNSSATIYAVVAAGKSALIYARVDVAKLFNDATLPGFLGFNGNNAGTQELTTTADVVALGLDSFWLAGDQQP